MNENHCPFLYSKESSYYSYIIFVFHYKSDQIFRDFHSNTPELSNPFTDRRDYQEDDEEDDAADELEQLLEEEEERREEKVEGLCSCCLLSILHVNYTCLNNIFSYFINHFIKPLYKL